MWVMPLGLQIREREFDSLLSCHGVVGVIGSMAGCDPAGEGSIPHFTPI